METETDPQISPASSSPIIEARMTSKEPTEESATRRVDHIDWETYFMAIAFVASKRSKDPNFQVGACVVNPEKKVVGIGYNGMPKGCHDAMYPWGKDRVDPLQSKFTFVCHAEMNAITMSTASVKDGTIYVGLFPCNECAKLIIQSGIKRIVFVSDKNHDKPENKASRKMLTDADVIYKQFEARFRLFIDFGVDYGDNLEVR